MKVCVINGSPKGNFSVTLQVSLFFEKKFKDIEFEVVNVGQQIRVISKDPSNVFEAAGNTPKPPRQIRSRQELREFSQAPVS